AADSVPVWQGHVHTCRKWICANAAELDQALGEWAERGPLLAQPFVVGAGGGVFGLATHEGGKAWGGDRRLRMMNPQGSGSSACISQLVSEDIRANVTRLIERTGWRGLFMVELLRDEQGQLWFVEFNGRPWGSISLSRRQGLDYPHWHVSQF